MDIYLNALKQQLDRETVILLLSFMAYEFNRKGMFKLRPEERTASASVDKGGWITDFGSGWRGDIFALLMEYHGMTFPSSVQYVADCLGVSNDVA